MLDCVLMWLLIAAGSLSSVIFNLSIPKNTVLHSECRVGPEHRGPGNQDKIDDGSPVK